MMTLYDEQEVMRSYVESECYEAAQEAAQEATQKKAEKAAIRMIQLGKMSLEDIAECVELTLDAVKALEAQIMQPAP